MENDWADEIVEKCRWMQGSIGALEMARQLRAAELRGRVAGMREAAEIAGVFGGGGAPSDYASGMEDAIGNATRYILEAADELESPPAT